MPEPSPADVTELLLAWSNGDQAALDKLTPLVYEELSRLAHRYMAREQPGHELQTTALVHEAYVRLVDGTRVRWQNRAHFFAVSAKLMRRILVDFARARLCEKRGGHARQVSLDEALTALAGVDGRMSRVVELRFFGGLSIEETAEARRRSRSRRTR